MKEKLPTYEHALGETRTHEIDLDGHAGHQYIICDTRYMIGTYLNLEYEAYIYIYKFLGFYCNQTSVTYRTVW